MGRRKKVEAPVQKEGVFQVKIQTAKQRFVKNGGMHLLNNFIPVGEIKEIELADKDLFILDSEEFKYYFELVGQQQPKEIIQNEETTEDWD